MDALTPLGLRDATGFALHRCQAVAAAIYEAVAAHPALGDDSTATTILWELARTIEERADAAIAAHDAEHHGRKA